MLTFFVRLVVAIAFASLISDAVAQTRAESVVPSELWGKWTIVREINTRTISCWGEKQARQTIGTAITYSPNGLIWKNLRTRAQGAKVRLITARQFHDENSGGSTNGSQIDFQQLGIKGPVAKQITIHHPDQSITGTTSEFPGDEVLVRAPDSIVFSLCNLYFEAIRVVSRSK